MRRSYEKSVVIKWRLQNWNCAVTHSKNITKKWENIGWKAKIQSFPTTIWSFSDDSYRESYCTILISYFSFYDHIFIVLCARSDFISYRSLWLIIRAYGCVGFISIGFISIGFISDGVGVICIGIRLRQIIINYG